MPYKIILFSFLILFGASACFAQDNPVKKNRINNNVTEKYHVSPANPEVKDGIYQAFYGHNKLIAQGFYLNGKKRGTWRFYSPLGTNLEVYNFDKDSLEFEAFENNRSDFRYLVDRQLTDSDKTRKPYKVGGRYYGYLPYLTAFKMPFSVYWEDTPHFWAQVELVISPLGRLADYSVHVIGPDYDQKFNLSLNFFKEEDRQFIPARINNQPVICRIVINCKLTDDGGLDFY